MSVANQFIPSAAAHVLNFQIYDFMNTQLTYNQTYAYRLPPSYIEQARALADFHEDGVFSDKQANGVGNSKLGLHLLQSLVHILPVAGRTLLHTILTSLERIAFNDDPLQFMLVQTSYQPFISLFHQTEIAKAHPELKAIRTCYSSSQVSALILARYTQPTLVPPSQSSCAVALRPICVTSCVSNSGTAPLTPRTGA